MTCQTKGDTSYMEKRTGVGGTLLSQKEGVSMARLTNEQIRNMPIDEADAYTDAHPAEAWSFAKAHGASAIAQTKESGKAWLQDQGSICRTGNNRTCLITHDRP